MIFKAIIVVSLLKICTGNVPGNLQPQSNQAISSQSFVRHDVPLSYKYSSVHIYSTPKPDQIVQKPYITQGHPVRPGPSKIIQYAPIYNGQRENVPENVNLPIEKTHLEPKPQEFQNLEHHPNHLSYVPGYNVEVLQSANRYPGHNAIYRRYPNVSPNEKFNKVNYLNQYLFYHKPEHQYITTTENTNEYVTTPKLLEEAQVTLAPFVPKLQTVQKPKLYEYDFPRVAAVKLGYSPQGLINIQEMIPHPKPHKMFLNIARKYNIAFSPQKAQHAPLTLLKNVAPSHTQAIININPQNTNMNTRLLAVQSKQMHQSAK